MVRGRALEIRRACLTGLLALIGVLAWASAASAACRPGNLLLERAPVKSRGVERAERLTDGWLAPEGHAADAPEAAPMTGLRAFVQWDLGEPLPIVAAAVQADHDDIYRLSGSVDGRRFEPIWDVDRVPEQGLRERSVRDLGARARYLRFEVVNGRGKRGAAEVRVYCHVPEPWPPYRQVQRIVTTSPADTRFAQIASLKVVIGLTSLGLVVWILPRLRREGFRRAILGALVGLGALSWIQLGHFHEHGVVHFWNSLHYFMGTKYFPELGYFELYRCGAAAEREAGRGALMDRGVIRDLEDNRVRPGSWTRTEEGRCRGRFSEERWAAFRTDLETYRSMFGDAPLARAFVDHGFNATPVHTAWLRLLTARLDAGPRTAAWLAQLDSLALVLCVAFMYWGFGPLAAAVVALMIGLGHPWDYSWTGGALGRHTWLAFACAGLALLRRERLFWGALALTTAALLRLFPVVFLGGLGLWVVAGWIRERRLGARGKKALAGIGVTLAVGLTVGGVVNGFEAYPEFVRVMQRHSSEPFANQMGLPPLLGLRVGQGSASLVDERLTDPDQVWKDQTVQNQRERRPLWIFAVALSLGVVLWGAARGATAWECAVLTGPLAFSAVTMTSYDYLWLVLLAAIVANRRGRAAWLIGFVVSTQLFGLFVPSLEARHVFYSLGALALIAVLSLETLRDIEARRTPSGEDGEGPGEAGGRGDRAAEKPVSAMHVQRAS